MKRLLYIFAKAIDGKVFGAWRIVSDAGDDWAGGSRKAGMRFFWKHAFTFRYVRQNGVDERSVSHIFEKGLIG